MGDWVKRPDGGFDFVVATRSPERIMADMRTVEDPQEALKLCRELGPAMADWLMYYQP